MSSGTLHRLTEKKGKQLSKFLGIDSVPSTQLIANMQSRINNPIFKLSMTDYEDLTEETATKIFEGIKNDKIPKPGSQKGRVGFEP